MREHVILSYPLLKVAIEKKFFLPKNLDMRDLIEAVDQVPPPRPPSPSSDSSSDSEPELDTGLGKTESSDKDDILVVMQNFMAYLDHV